MFGKTWGTILLQIYLDGPYDPYPSITPIITNDSILELKYVNCFTLYKLFTLQNYWSYTNTDGNMTLLFYLWSMYF